MTLISMMIRLVQTTREACKAANKTKQRNHKKRYQEDKTSQDESRKQPGI